ncbi:MAG: hypothetical protein JSU96_01175 [Acidobacteriota bacterium]|nr:MAG: hypothetical protein JSU96_01175 [Acidobacteriota bacterium]
MFKDSKIRILRPQAMVSVLALIISGTWLYLANLGCLAEELLDGMAVVLTPHRLTLAPNATVTSEAKVVWGSESVGPSTWEVDGKGIAAFQSVSLSPRKGHETTVSVTGADYDAVYDESRFSFSSFSEYSIPISATFDHPVVSAALGGGVPVTRQKYLSLQAANPQMELTVPAFAPILHAESDLLNGGSSVRGLVFAAKAEIKNAPSNWKYKFDFYLRVEAHGSGGGNTTVHLTPKDLSPTTAPSGQLATLKFNNLNLGMDDRFNDSLWALSSISGQYLIYLDVEAVQVAGGDGTFWQQEFLRYPLYINSN